MISLSTLDPITVMCILRFLEAVKDLLQRDSYAEYDTMKKAEFLGTALTPITAYLGSKSIQVSKPFLVDLVCLFHFNIR